MKKLALLLLMVIFTLHGKAQFGAGIKTGLAFQNMSANGFVAAVEEMTSPITTGHLGVFGEYTVNSLIELRVGINYSRKGTMIGFDKDINLLGMRIPTGINARFRTDYLDIPVSTSVRFSHGPWAGYVLAGGGVSRALNSVIEPSAHLLIDFNLPDIHIPVRNINSVETFGLGGLGISHQTENGKVFTEFQYQHSFEKVTPDYLIDLDLKNKGFSVGVGYAMSF